MEVVIDIIKRPVLWSLFFFLPLTVSAQHFDWALAEGGLGLDVGRDICTDNEGNVIVVGSFSGRAAFADTFLIGLGQHEAFICKYTSEGELLWARMISGPKEDLARGVMTDPYGNIFVVGHFTDTAVVVQNDEEYVAMGSAGGQDVFVIKYDSDGNYQWLVSGGGSGNDTGTDLAWHPSGSILVCGGFEQRATFGQSAVLSYGLSDAFVMKIDNYGGVHWVKHGGGDEHDVAASISVDQIDGWVYIAGDYYEHAVFSGTQLEAVGSSDIFLAKYSEDGEFQWAVDNGGTAVDVATKVGTDLQGHVFLSGYYQSTTYFQEHSVTALSYNDVFLAKFDASGTCEWLRSAGSWGLDNCLGMDVAWDGTTYLTGLFEELIIADGDSTYGDGYDIFILNYDPEGQIRYGKAAGAGSADVGMAVGLGPDRSLYVTGYFYYFADFDQSTIGPADHGDIFVARLTDIVGINEPVHPDNEDCLRYDPFSTTVNLLCATGGVWSLYNNLGQLIMSGKSGSSQIVLGPVRSGYYHFVLDGGSSRRSIPIVVP